MNGSILIVDDEMAELTLLKDILSAEGYRVRPFSNGELALRSIMTEQPELILLDIRMPDLDGIELCHRLKENTSLREIPVIFISAASDLEDKIKAFQVGGVDYITTPFQKEEVTARVRNHITLYRTLQDMKSIGEILRKSEESLKIAQAIAHLGHWEWDMNNGGIVWSEETYRILGLEPEEKPASYDAFLQVVHPDDRDRVAAKLKALFSGEDFDVEYRIILPGGKVRVVHGKAEIININASNQHKLIGTIQEISEPEQAKILGVIQDITEQKELEWKLEQQANTDYLTGCLSRRYFLGLSEREFAQVRRYGGVLSLFMIDLDHFKKVNDEHGHQVGDEALKKLVQVCQSVLREVDLVGRLGGEEFAVLLPETNRAQAIEAAERLRVAVASAEVPLEGDTVLQFTTSIGVATLSGADTNISDILRRADQALYQAKNFGRNKVYSSTTS